MKKMHMKKWMDRITGRMVNWLPEFACGKEKTIAEKYRRIYGKQDWQEETEKDRKRTAILYLVILVCFAPLFAVGAIQEIACLQESGLTSIQRPVETTVQVPLEATMEYKGKIAKKKMDISVNPKEGTEQENLALLQQITKELPGRIFGKSGSSEAVSADLNLPDSVGGVEIIWSSDRPAVLDERGKLHLLAAKEGQKVCLHARLFLKNQETEMDIPITIHLPKEEETTAWSQAMEQELEDTLDAVRDRAKTGGVLSLPTETKNGMKVQWKKARDTVFLPICALLGVCWAFVFRRRYRRADRIFEKTKESIRLELPDLMNKMVLLLSAGLVAGSALERIAEESRRAMERGESVSILLLQLEEVQRRVAGSNASLYRELSDMAAKSEVQELMRFVSLIGDNMDKGNALAEKIEVEAGMLWQNRRKHAESKGRVAETKLTFPLTALLLALVVLTAAPALL